MKSALSKWIAAKELKFGTPSGKQITVPAGTAIPVEALKACNSRQLGRILDPLNGCVLRNPDFVSERT